MKDLTTEDLIAQLRQKLTEELAQIQHRWPQDLPLDGKEQTTVCVPFLFSPAFPTVSTQQVWNLALAGHLFARSILIWDDIIDHDSSQQHLTMNALRTQALEFEAYHLLYQLFPPHTSFWKRFQHYLFEYSEALLLKNHFATGKRPWHEYSEDLVLRLIEGNAGIARAVIAGLAELDQNEQYLEPFTESLKHYYIAAQMLDDIWDWKEDLRLQRPSLLLVRASSTPPSPTQQQEVAQTLYYDHHLRYVLELAISSLEKSDDLVAAIPTLPWRLPLKKLRTSCETLLTDTEQIIRKNRERLVKNPAYTLNLPQPQSNLEKITWDALRFLIQQWYKGFGEARHIMEFPREGGFHSAQRYQHGDIFQRAIIADALCDVSPFVSDQLQQVLASEVNYLLEQQYPSKLGGWSYFRELRDLPPDADDLAQVMQVLLRTGHHQEVTETCQNSLDLIQAHAYPDGSFETWLIPQENRTQEEQRHAECVNLFWGRGPDTDVIANLLYALTLFDRESYGAFINRSIIYLETCQQPEGSWYSTWYHGPYYGTFQCLRLLAEMKPDSPARQSALGFLRSIQHTDGGWGLDLESDPLSTALAVLGLVYGQRQQLSVVDQKQLKSAFNYLGACQDLDRGWQRCDLIRMELGRARGKVSSILSYGSRTITTAFVLKALVACRPWLEPSAVSFSAVPLACV